MYGEDATQLQDTLEKWLLRSFLDGEKRMQSFPGSRFGGRVISQGVVEILDLVKRKPDLLSKKQPIRC